MSAMAAGGGARGLFRKSCCFPFVFWLLSVCGEERTLMVEVGSMAFTHLRATTSARGRCQLTWMSVTSLLMTPLVLSGSVCV